MRHLILFFFFPFFLNCVGKPNEPLKIQPKEACIPVLDNQSTLTDTRPFAEFIKIIQDKDCFNFKKWLGESVYYSLDETNIILFFYRKNQYYNFKTSVCDFFFDQLSFESKMLKETKIDNLIAGRELVVNSKEISISSDIGVQNEQYRVTLEVATCLKNGNPDSGLPTMLLFKCIKTPHSHCFFEGVSTWTRIRKGD